MYYYSHYSIITVTTVLLKLLQCYIIIVIKAFLQYYYNCYSVITEPLSPKNITNFETVSEICFSVCWGKGSAPPPLRSAIPGTFPSRSGKRKCGGKRKRHLQRKGSVKRRGSVEGRGSATWKGRGSVKGRRSVQGRGGATCKEKGV